MRKRALIEVSALFLLGAVVLFFFLKNSYNAAYTVFSVIIPFTGIIISKKNNEYYFLTIKNIKGVLKDFILIGMPLLIFFVVLYFTVYHFYKSDKANDEDIGKFIYASIFPFFIAPICEEFCFRGYYQNRIKDIISKEIVIYKIKMPITIIITSMLFIMPHLIKDFNIFSILVFFPSMLFGYAAERQKTILSPILLHCAANMEIGFLMWKLPLNIV